MVDRELGMATIVYEGPDDETVERTVQNEHIAYFQDHWIIKTGEDESGNDVVVRIPHQRVFHVERSVEAFKDEVTTLRKQLESVTEELRSRFLGRSQSERDSKPIEIEADQSTSQES